MARGWGRGGSASPQTCPDRSPPLLPLATNSVCPADGQPWATAGQDASLLTEPVSLRLGGGWGATAATLVPQPWAVAEASRKRLNSALHGPKVRRANRPGDTQTGVRWNSFAKPGPPSTLR